MTKSIRDTASAVSRDQEAADYIGKWLSYWFDRASVPGMSVVIRNRDGALLDRQFGYADLNKEERLGKRHSFAVASQTKMMTAVGLGILQDRGILNFSDPLARHIKWLKSSHPMGRMTIDRVLQHRAWLPRSAHIEEPSFKKDTRSIAPLFNNVRHGFKYSNWGYGLLGSVIEGAAGVSYADFIQAEILDPLGMRHTTMNLDDVKNLAMGYGAKVRDRYIENPATSPLEMLDPAFGFYSTPADMSAFALFYDRLLNHQTAHQLHTAVNPANGCGGEFYGRGFQSYRLGARLLKGHGGLRGGHCSMTLSHKGLGVAASICVNLNSFSPDELTIGALQIVSFYHDHPDARYKGRYKDWRDFDIFEMPQGYVLFAPDDERPADVPLFPRTGKNTCLIKGVSDYGSPGETIRISGKTLSYGV